MANEVLSLEKKRRQECKHKKFIVSTDLGYVICANCGEHLNPMYVLSRLVNEETRLERRKKELLEVKERLARRKGTRCQHCGRMTKIKDHGRKNGSNGSRPD